MREKRTRTFTCELEGCENERTENVARYNIHATHFCSNRCRLLAQNRIMVGVPGCEGKTVTQVAEERKMSRSTLRQRYIRFKKGIISLEEMWSNVSLARPSEPKPKKKVIELDDCLPRLKHKQRSDYFERMG